MAKLEVILQELTDVLRKRYADRYEVVANAREAIAGYLEAVA